MYSVDVLRQTEKNVNRQNLAHSISWNKNEPNELPTQVFLTKYT